MPAPSAARATSNAPSSDTFTEVKSGSCQPCTKVIRRRVSPSIHAPVVTPTGQRVPLRISATTGSTIRGCRRSRPSASRGCTWKALAPARSQASASARSSGAVTGTAG